MIGAPVGLSNHRWKELSDDALLAEARGSPSDDAREAASVLLERYGERVYQWCFRYARDHDGAMDLAQQSLLRAYDKLHTFEGRSAFSSWVFAVTRSTCLNAMQRATLHYDPEFDLGEIPDDRPDPQEKLELSQERERQLSVIKNVLDENEQEAVIMRYFEQLSPDEITRSLGLTSRSGARGLLQRARRKLVAALEAPDGGASHGA